MRLCLWGLSWPMEGTVVVFESLGLISDLDVDVVSTSLE